MAKKKKEVGNRPDRRKHSLVDISVEHLLGSIIINWNNLEKSSKLLLGHLLGNPKGIQSVTNELKGQSLWHALRAASTHCQHGEISTNIIQLSKAIEYLNEHRNYYVHGAISKNGESLVLQSEYAKGEVRHYEDAIDKWEMWQIASDCEDIGMDAINLIAYLLLKKTGQHPELPDMHFLPPQLSRTRDNR